MRIVSRICLLFLLMSGLTLIFNFCLVTSEPEASDREWAAAENDVQWECIGPDLNLSGNYIYDLSYAYADGSGYLYAAIGWLGLYKWSEAAETWASVDVPQPLNSCYCSNVVVDPINPYIVYAGFNNLSSQEIKILRSANGGQDWEVYTLASPNETSGGHTLKSIAIDSGNHDIIFFGTQNGVARSTDSGKSSVMLTNGIPTAGFIVWTVAVDPTNGSVVFAGGEDWLYLPGWPTPRFFKSEDGGESWVEVHGQGSTWPGWIPTDTAIEPENGTILVATEGTGLRKSTDKGETWKPIGDPGYETCGLTSPDVLSIKFDPQNSSVAYAGTYSVCGGPGGVFKSTDRGETWMEKNNGLDAREVGNLAIDESGEVLYASCGVYNETEGIKCKGVYRTWLSLKVHNIDTELNYKTIQEAINAPETLDGHTIFVEEGTYYENIVVNKTVTLFGENKDATIIDGNGTENVVYINSDNITVEGFTIRNSGTENAGILLNHVNHCNATENNIVNNKYGIISYDSSFNIISVNTMRENEYGVSLGLSFNNTLFENDIIDNVIVGILFSNSSLNAIVRNNIVSNYYGVHLGHSSNNIFWHNNFIENDWTQAYITSSGYANLWDIGYPSGGNYWSDYDGTDLFLGPFQNETGSDGIGDTPYIIDENNVDSYPLVNPWIPPDVAVVNVSTSKNVVGEGFTLNVTVIVTNQGNKIENINTIVYANETAITSQTFLLKSGDSLIYTFTWNTTSFAYGNYTVTAYTDTIPGELDISDNAFTNGCILVTVPGDVDGDFDVDIYDIVKICGCYGSKEGDTQFIANCDIDGDGDIDIYDIVAMCNRYGETYP